VADRKLTEAVGDALVAFVEWAWPRGGDGASLLLDKLAETLRPDPPLAIRTTDGQLLTGLLVADRGHVLLFIGTRATPPGPLSSPHEQPVRRYQDDAIPPWARDLDVNPYRR
jgi:hypothetical protein